MQEEMLEETRQLSSACFKHDYSRTTFRSGSSGKGVWQQQPTKERKKTEEKPPWLGHFNALKAQRRARGECFKCGDKYEPGHHCSKTVALNVVEELWDLLQLEANSDKNHDVESSGEEGWMKISYCASPGTVAKRKIRLQASVHAKQVLILVDSGSSGSFILQKTVDDL
jgi:hypothetical protein